MATPVINGTPVNFGAPNSDILDAAGTGPLFKGTLTQRFSEGVACERELIRDYSGARVADSNYDPRFTFELEFVICAPAATNTLAGAKAATILTSILPGKFLTLSVSADMPDITSPAVGTYEVVGTPKIEASNTTSKRVTVQLERCAGLTAVAT